MTQPAVLLANDLFQDPHAKTSHALVRGPSRYAIVAVVDASCGGQDAGEALDGRRRDIPIVASIDDALKLAPTPEVAIIGVATAGGVLPDSIRASLRAAAAAGLTLVNGLHRPLADDADLARIAAEGGAKIIDLRKPRPVGELRFWSGDILTLSTPRVAMLGMDCAIGKRTLALSTREALRQRGVRAEVVYTGQTGWLAGLEHGFFFDATPNDFVCGELEHAILECQRERDPQVILIEGQASLRNPSGPCGSEFLIAGGARWVVLQHAPGRPFYVDAEGLDIPIGSVADEIRLIEMYGATVVAVGLHEAQLTSEQAQARHARLAHELDVTVLRPWAEGAAVLAELLCDRLGLEDS